MEANIRPHSTAALQVRRFGIELVYGELKLKQLYQYVTTLPQRPVVLLNMCNSAQVTPSLKQSFIEFFLGRGASAVVGTECSMRPLFADFVGRELLPDLINGIPIGQALLRVRQKAANQRNLMGLAYTLFGWADAKPWQFDTAVKQDATHPH